MSSKGARLRRSRRETVTQLDRQHHIDASAYDCVDVVMTWGPTMDGIPQEVFDSVALLTVGFDPTLETSSWEERQKG